MTALELVRIAHAFGATPVLDEVSLAVARGELVVILGPSGCGKSTLLRIVAGLVAADSGELWIDGRRAEGLEPQERGVALVFQNYALYPHMTVRANLGFPLKMARIAAGEIAARVERTAERLGLGALLERKPEALSGGQMQRVALGRALVREPRLFLFDEPLSNLDASLRTELRAEIGALVRQLGAERGTAALYVTHDQAEAMTLATRLVVMRGGRIEQVGTPLEVYRRPATSFVASFVGHPPMSLLTGRARGGRLRLGPLELAAPLAEGELVLGIRPEEIVCGRGVRLPVRAVEALGAVTHVELALGEGTLRASMPGDQPLPAGELAVELPSEALHWFDGTTGQRVDGAPGSSLGPPGPSPASG